MAKYPRMAGKLAWPWRGVQACWRRRGLRDGTRAGDLKDGIMTQIHGHGAEDKPAAANPVMAEATRGGAVESWHRASLAVVDTSGRVVLSAGDVEAPIFGRSAIKPLQALPLIESGAAEAFGLSDAEIAMACASHGGEPRHVETVAAWLKKIGCTPADLECGTHLPSNEAAMVALLRGGADPSALHNNCSGKHTGFLTFARHAGFPTQGYIRFDHPVQQRVLGVLESMTGLDLSQAVRGLDGCGIPVIAIPLGNTALAMARLADPSDQPEARQAACARVLRAMAAEPFLVAGSDRYCTRAMTLLKGRAIIKTGAEGVYCGAVPGAGLGFAVKADDGAGRAAEAVVGQLLQRLGLLSADEAKDLALPLRNRAGTLVGEVRPVRD